MRLHCIVVLAVVAFVTNGNEVSAGKSRVTITGTSTIDTPTTRLLRTQYTDEERAFGSKKISSFLTDMKQYLKSKREIDNVFIILKLDKAGDKLFENPKFAAWARYVDAFDKKHQTTNSMLPALERRFGGGDLSVMLEKAKQADKTYVVARLQRQQMASWRREGLTTDQLFKFYKLDDGATNLLENPGLKIWMKYADDFINPEDPTLVVKKLQKTYSDEALAQVLLKGKSVASTKKLATDLQLRLWLKDLVPPEKVFRLLSLNKADDVFGSPQFQTWIRYSKDYAKQNPHAHKATLTDTLLENFDTAAIVRLVKTRPDTISGKHYASQVERDLIKRWVAEGKSFDFVVAKLGTSTTNQEFVAGLYNKYKKLQTTA